MNTFIYIPPVKSEKTPPPNCPHCEKPLEGFYKESPFTVGEIFVSAALILLVVLQGFGVIKGITDSNFHPCRTLGEKRWHYIMPTDPLACQLGRWLNNEEYITYQDRKKALEEN